MPNLLPFVISPTPVCHKTPLNPFPHSLWHRLKKSTKQKKEAHSKAFYATTAAVAGTGIAAAGLLGTYLYYKPVLRGRMKKASTMSSAMNLLGKELQHNGRIAAGKAVTSASSATADGLKCMRCSISKH